MNQTIKQTSAKHIGLSLFSALLLLASLGTTAVSAQETNNNSSIKIVEKNKQLKEAEKNRIQQEAYKKSIEAEIKSLKLELREIGERLINHPANEYNERDSEGTFLSDKHEQLMQSIASQERLLKDVDNRLNIAHRNEARIRQSLKKYQTPAKESVVMNGVSEKKYAVRQNVAVYPKKEQTNTATSSFSSVNSQKNLTDLQQQLAKAELNHKEAQERRQAMEAQKDSIVENIASIKSDLLRVGEQLEQHPANEYSERDSEGTLLENEHQQLQQKLVQQEQFLQKIEGDLVLSHRQEAFALRSVRKYQDKLMNR